MVTAAASFTEFCKAPGAVLSGLAGSHLVSIPRQEGAATRLILLIRKPKVLINNSARQAAAQSEKCVCSDSCLTEVAPAPCWGRVTVKRLVRYKIALLF